MRGSFERRGRFPGRVGAAPLWCAAALICTAPRAGWAQAPGAAILPPQLLPPQGSPLPGIERNAPPPAGTPLPLPPAAAPGAVNPAETVPITEVAALQGVETYPPGVLDEYTRNLVGPATPVARIEAARTAILNRYRGEGYVYTTVQAHIRSGRLTFVVTEGHVVAVKLQGDEAEIRAVGPVGNLVLRFLRNLVSDRAVNAHELERYLLLVNDIPGLTVTTHMDFSPDNPGAATLIARVVRTPVSVQLTADNRAFRETGPEELLATASFNSFTSLGERTELSMYHTFDNTDNFGQASEEFFVGSDGLRVRVYGGAGESLPSGVLGRFGYDGVTRVFGASLAYPLIRSRERNLTLSALFDGVESDISTLVNGAPKRSSFDSLRVLRGNADYTQGDYWWPGHGASVFAEFRISQGLPAFGASNSGGPQLPRLHERVDFTKETGELDRTQALFAPFRNAEVSLKAAVEGQYSGNVLPPEEEFYLGGPHFNRGFYYGEVTGDKGLATTIEPQLDMPLFRPASLLGGASEASPEASPEPSPWRDRYLTPPVRAQIYGFYDWGEVWQNQQLDPGQRLRSIGGGVRIYNAEQYGQQKIEFDIEGVSRLTRSPENGPGVSRLKSSALYWQVLVSF